MKKIKFLTEDSIEMLKKNADALYKEVILTGDKTLEEFMREAGEIKETAFEIDDFVLEMGQSEGNRDCKEITGNCHEK